MGAQRSTPNALQTMYREGVPHTDRMGRRRTQFHPAHSFLPIGLYHTLTGRHFGRTYSLKAIADAGFNAVHPWEGQPLDSFMTAARHYGLQVIVHRPAKQQITQYANDPSILAWYLDEEPTGFYDNDETRHRLKSFQDKRRDIQRHDPNRPVFALDGPPLPNREQDWDLWAQAGDVSVHFNYPIYAGSTETLIGENGFSETIRRAVKLNIEKKPVWFVAQSFQGRDVEWTMPTPNQLRAMVYGAFIHGATGIIFFGFDSFVMRDGNVLGISPEPVSDYGPTPDFDGSETPPLLAKTQDLKSSRAAWSAAQTLAGELKLLSPALLSPTSRQNINIRIKGISHTETPIRALLKEFQGHQYLFVVNLDSAPLKVFFKLRHQPEELRVQIGNNKALVKSASGWHDQLEGFAVRVYRFR